MLIGSTGEALKAASHLPERGHEKRLQSRLPSVELGIPGIKVVESCQTEENLIASIPKLLPMSRWWCLENRWVYHWALLESEGLRKLPGQEPNGGQRWGLEVCRTRHWGDSPDTQKTHINRVDHAQTSGRYTHQLVYTYTQEPAWGAARHPSHDFRPHKARPSHKSQLQILGSHHTEGSGLRRR